MSLTLTILKLIFFILTIVCLVECRNFQIVGGLATTIQQFPFQVIYYSEDDFVCSGSLISPSFILTAAHCTYYFPSEITVRLGSSFRDRDGITANVSRFYTHPNYNSRTYDYDFALLKLEDPIKYERNILPARLPKVWDNLNVGARCTVSGWGLESFNDLADPPVQLLVASVNVVDFKKCQSNYQKVSQNITERMFCASVPDGSQDACLGDSGGPLVCNGVLWGVISFGYGCAMKEYPGIYSRIPLVLSWIKKVAQIL